MPSQRGTAESELLGQPAFSSSYHMLRSKRLSCVCTGARAQEFPMLFRRAAGFCCVVLLSLLMSACAGLGGGSSATPTPTPAPAGSLNSINHIVLFMQENRSFDSYFGQLNAYRAKQTLRFPKMSIPGPLAVTRPRRTFQLPAMTQIPERPDHRSKHSICKARALRI